MVIKYFTWNSCIPDVDTVYFASWNLTYSRPSLPPHLMVGHEYVNLISIFKKLYMNLNLNSTSIGIKNTCLGEADFTKFKNGGNRK